MQKSQNVLVLNQEIGFSAPPNSCSLPWLVKVQHSCCAPPKKSVINWTWLRLSIFDWSIIMIGPGGLIVVPTYMQFQLQSYWWGLPKVKTAKLRHLNFIIQSDILSTRRCSKWEARWTNRVRQLLRKHTISHMSSW